VTVDEIIALVQIAFGRLPAQECTNGDTNDDGRIRVDEILAAVNRALEGCGNRAAGFGLRDLR